MAQTLRRIRSYVRREGRLTEGQRVALEKHWPVYGVEYDQKTLNLEKLFGRQAPLILDIGTGKGDSCLGLAKSHPENNYLAVEVHRPGVGSLLRQIATESLTNIRVSNHDVIDVLTHQLPTACIDEVYIFFPDPWPKKRHNKRRLINPVFLQLLASRLKHDAKVFIATDWEDYAESILDAFSRMEEFVNLSTNGRMIMRPDWRPITKFERRGEQLGHQVYDFAFSYLPRDSISEKS